MMLTIYSFFLLLIFVKEFDMITSVTSVFLKLDVL